MNSFFELYSYGEKKLADAGVFDSSFDAMELLLYAFDMDKNYYYLNNNKDLSSCGKWTEEAHECYIELIEKRALRIPLQHILGVAPFYGYEFIVNSDVLVPRFDTENLVEAVISIARKKDHVKILDMCTGSGCIAITLKKELEDADVYAVDISDKALATAKLNADKLSADITFAKSDLWQSVPDEWGTFDIIVSNPPYIKTEEISDLTPEVKDHDPFIALDGLEDGLFFYREITKNAGNYLNDNGYLMYEIGDSQREEVKEIFKINGYCDIISRRDLNNKDRVIYGKRGTLCLIN